MKRFAMMLGLAMALVSVAMGADTFESRIGSVKVGPVNDAGAIQFPYIIWGGEVPLFMANGGLTTTKDSDFGKAGLKLKLVAGDDFQSQVKDYLSGKSPFLRCTLGMAAQASQVLNRDPATKPVMFMQLTWSAGDHLVARDTVKNLNSLKGKKICIQTGGPHLTLVDDSLKAVGLTWNDITVVWAKNLTGPDSPAEMIKKDPSIDIAGVITPDMIGLCSGIDQTGTGAEGTLKGGHVVNSTASMSHSIADVFFVRKDYFDSHRDQVQAIVVGYLKATEQLMELKKVYDDGKGNSPQYMATLKMAQDIYGSKVLPTLEADAHGLVVDATFVRIPGNEAFFDDPTNLSGYEAKTNSALDMAATLGLITEKTSFAKADWDYKKISEAVGVKYNKPTFATGRVKAEVTDFTKDLDTNTIFSFEIKFEPEQTKFDINAYASQFQRVLEAQSNFGNAVILIRGHSDSTLALQNFFWAAQAKGLITGSKGNYKFNGKPLDLTDTSLVVNAIQSENFAGLTRVNKEGKTVEIDDPKSTVASALSLSKSRVENVKVSLEQYAKSKMYMVDFSQIQLQPVGIAEPINPQPRNMQQAKENMRVEFRVIRVSAEVLKEGDFEFDK